MLNSLRTMPSVMRLSLPTQLFAAVFATAMAVALAMGLAAQINLNRDFLGYLNEQAVNRLELMADGTLRQETFILSETKNADSDPRKPGSGEGGG